MTLLLQVQSTRRGTTLNRDYRVCVIKSFKARTFSVQVSSDSSYIGCSSRCSGLLVDVFEHKGRDCHREVILKDVPDNDCFVCLIFQPRLEKMSLPKVKTEFVASGKWNIIPSVCRQR